MVSIYRGSNYYEVISGRNDLWDEYTSREVIRRMQLMGWNGILEKVKEFLTFEMDYCFLEAGFW
jgi:hypothetical protein